jgi:hypothetical protein
MRFIDPMFRLGTPHEQWRQMAPIPGLLDEVAREYFIQTGRVTNTTLVQALGAVTHLSASVLRPEQAPLRRKYLVQCLDNLEKLGHHLQY